MQAISFTDLEIDVVLGFSTLKLDVLRNDLIGHNAGGCYEEPRAQRCRPQNDLLSALKSRISRLEVLPLMACITLLGTKFGGTDNKR